LYAWKRQLAKVVSGDASKDAEIRQLKRELARVTEERDILKKVAGLARLCAVETGRVLIATEM
jgi:transposase